MTTTEQSTTSIHETSTWARGGSLPYIGLGIFLLALIGLIPLVITSPIYVVAIGIWGLAFGFYTSMLRIVGPGQSLVIQLFGKYEGTVRTEGLLLIKPFRSSTKTSLRVRNFETGTLKVNDLNGNPIHIGSIIVWRIFDTAKATFAVEDVNEFIQSQAESALRQVATTHPYDSNDANQAPSLSGSTDIVSAALESAVAERVELAGIEILEARISSLSYAPEIAQAMLQRQQAAAIVNARETIVEGAVTMVESALEQLERREIVDLDPERRAAMVSNLLVVLCSDNAAQPVLNTGSLYA
ncbi:SPFH domain-containing protein [Corynebacterium sp. HS2168-gen11]|uniref:SPFH domain-containing protein n=1 Tax=Corynebacterium sp. HS2168-gen11 TaxID=2974027 RepID=UPI00216B594A|nr:SPFH domain-containing protein [Corynebacterium sp. HS2168-gen11]MCS4535951.1 SPFH domain-containing protein [Corynebacterium sp. HS2168-gen11]